MDKRYQVFVSSTYVDLKDERQSVTQTLMEMDCIPAGMELFPAADEEQWTFIQRVIDDCDYYLLIIGGRYGSLSEEGVSYTEKEFDYAVSKGLRVVALIHQNPGVLPLEKSEISEDFRARLNAFRVKVSTGRVVKFWNHGAELPGLVSLSLAKTIKLFPARGWIRANESSNEELLIEINELRKLNDSLSAQLNNLGSQKKSSYEISDLADINEAFQLKGSYANPFGDSVQWKFDMLWKDIFYYMSPYLIGGCSPDLAKETLKDAACSQINAEMPYASLDDQVFQTVAIQLQALGFVAIGSSNSEVKSNLWTLTPRGEQLMVELRAVRKS